MSESRDKALGATRCGRLPDGLRIYAIGDIHGRFDLLQPVHAQIRRDLAARPAEQSIEIFLGDYVDRGPQSRDVVEWLIRSEPACDERICLMGNHEDLLLGGLADAAGTEAWLVNGGIETLLSYRPTPRASLADMTLDDVRELFAEAFPESHRAFLSELSHMQIYGGYAFVHAGIDPDRPIDDQDPFDLLWIREPFLTSTADFGLVVVHGHTPAVEPEVRPNRINVDTGAFFTGRLTCLALEGVRRRFLDTGGG